MAALLLFPSALLFSPALLQLPFQSSMLEKKKMVAHNLKDMGAILMEEITEQKKQREQQSREFNTVINSMLLYIGVGCWGAKLHP